MVYFNRDSEGAFGSEKCDQGDARFGPELDWEKPWRDQVVGARMREKNGRKL